MDARKIAYTALLRMKRDGSYSNLMLNAILQAEKPSPQEKQFATALFYGVLERKLTLDYQISRYLKKKVENLDDEVLIALELGFYQLCFLDGVPQSAAVNESVKLIKNSRKKSAFGFVNAVLRSFQRDGCRMVLPEGDSRRRLSVETSIPEEILQRWEKDFSPEKAEAIAKACLGRPPLHLRVNPLLSSPEQAMELLAAEGVKTTVHPLIPNCLEAFHTGSISEKAAFQKGFVSVQDSASQLCALAVGAKPGERIFDLCAAPGSKSFVMAQEMQNQGEILSFDLYPARIALIWEGAKRLGITCIRAEVGDAREFRSEHGLADRVLCDVPCSGLGIIRRKPEIRWKGAEELDALPSLQKEILANAARYVKPGGILVYSTCSIAKAENEEVTSWFLDQYPEFQPEVFPETVAAVIGENRWQATLTPDEGNFDGFYIARMRRKEGSGCTTSNP